MTMRHAVGGVQQLITALQPHDPAAPVIWDDGTPVGRLVSWRGDYAELALCRPAAHGETAPPTVAELLTALQSAADGTTTFEGWKGGTYRMDARTRVYVAEYGTSQHGVIVSVAGDGRGAVVLDCVRVDVWHD